MSKHKDYTPEIILIEDGPEDAELTQHAFRNAGIRNPIIHLVDGAIAANFLFGKGDSAPTLPFSGARPCVILLDLKLPKLNGKELLQMLKTNERTRHVPVVMLTSSSLDPDIQECYDLGANSYVVKPVGFENFTKAVREIGLYWVLLNEVN